MDNNKNNSSMNAQVDKNELDTSLEIKSTLISRNVTILGHRTSVRLEPEMWTALREISVRENCSIHEICSLIHLSKNKNTSLTAAIRVFLMLYYRASSTEDGHTTAGHGSFENMKNRARISGDLKCGVLLKKSESRRPSQGIVEKKISCAPRVVCTRDDLVNRPSAEAAVM